MKLTLLTTLSVPRIQNGNDVADHIVRTGNPGVGVASVAVFKVACATTKRLRENPAPASVPFLIYTS